MPTKLVESFEPKWLKMDEGLERYDQLLKTRERETRALSSLATRMRLSQGSQYRADNAATLVGKALPAGGPPPWERYR